MAAADAANETDGASEDSSAWRAAGFDGAKILEVQFEAKKTSATPISVLLLVYTEIILGGRYKAGELNKEQPSQILEYQQGP